MVGSESTQFSICSRHREAPSKQSFQVGSAKESWCPPLHNLRHNLQQPHGHIPIQETQPLQQETSAGNQKPACEGVGALFSQCQHLLSMLAGPAVEHSTETAHCVANGTRAAVDVLTG